MLPDFLEALSTYPEDTNMKLNVNTDKPDWSTFADILKPQKSMNTHSTKLNFKLWLEFEEVDPNNWDIENEFCNIHVDLDDGRHYGLNVWTYKFLETTINEDRKTGQNLNGLYQIPPDLFVNELTRECIQQTIEDLLKIDDLEKVLNPSIYDKQNCKNKKLK